MCSISVEPIPSMILIPVASCHACQVASGSGSPAGTPIVAVTRRRPGTDPASIARSAVGAVEEHRRSITRDRGQQWRRDSTFSNSREAAPIRSGKITREPNPNVKAERGRAREEVVIDRPDSMSALERVGHRQSVARWKCIVAYGRPVVPDVKANSATSSAEVEGELGGLAGRPAPRGCSVLPAPTTVYRGMPPPADRRRSGDRRGCGRSGRSRR